ncbi:hypothetical protein MASR1M60_17860 [Rhodocyclaceae bacterium]
MNGLLKTTDAAASGVITLEAAATGATGFTVTDVKIDKAATTEKDTLTFSTANGDYYTGGKLYATIGGKAITSRHGRTDDAAGQPGCAGRLRSTPQRSSRWFEWLVEDDGCGSEWRHHPGSGRHGSHGLYGH